MGIDHNCLSKLYRTAGILYSEESTQHPLTSSWPPPGPRTLLLEPKRKHMLATRIASTRLPGFCIPVTFAYSFLRSNILRPWPLHAHFVVRFERVSMQKRGKCRDLWTESKKHMRLNPYGVPSGGKVRGIQATYPKVLMKPFTEPSA